MNNNTKILLNVIKQLGFDAYFYGGCSRNYLSPKVTIRNKPVDTIIITTAPIEKIKKTFANYQEKTDNSVLISFANTVSTVISYTDITELQNHTNFLCNTIYLLGEKKEAIKDFKINGHSALDDIQNSIVRCVTDDTKNFFTNNPQEILEAFVLMSIYGFTLEKILINGIKASIKHIKYLPIDIILNYFNKILVGNYAEQTLKLMYKLNIFKLAVYINNVRQPFFNIFDKQPELFDILLKVRTTNKEIHEIYSLLFLNNKDEFNKLVSIFPLFNNDDIQIINWLMNHINIIDEQDQIKQRQLIYESINDYIKTKNIHYLKCLIEHLAHIYKIINGHVNIQELIFNISCRPYFIDQLPITGFDIQQLSADDSYKDKLINIEEELIKLLIAEQKYPTEQDISTKFLCQAIKNSGVELKNGNN